ncbi:MAG TPA: DUF1992 domain-containing protein, partial [Jiangellaceae bacterium]|nr:DUF1992 domain-containing protein [Jiangellaceae bacterium]
MPYETWVDRRIRDGQERGEFDNLATAGKPLRNLDQPHDDDWWIKGLIERENLDATALLPPQIALRKEASTLPETILEERSEQAARDRAEDFNNRVRECWSRPLEGPAVLAKPVDVDDMVARWREHHASPQSTDTDQRDGEPHDGPSLSRRARVVHRLHRLVTLGTAP